MRVYRSIEDFSARNPVVTIGMFDGVHAGHRCILQQIEREKMLYDGESVLVTFWPHPRVFFGKTDNFNLLTTLEEKLELLEQTGLDACVIIPFSKEFAQLSPLEYIQTILVDGLKVKKVIIGYDHHYGKNGSGTFEMMQQAGSQFGFDVEQISAFSLNQTTISSTQIRTLIENGKIEDANALLSYRYFLTGTVVHGAKIGRTIGFPTANIQCESSYKKIPQNGVYVAQVQVDDCLRPAVVNIGTNPTVSDENRQSIEVHLIDYDGELYGKTVRVNFVSRLRNEKKFNSLQELQQAIRYDVQMAKRCYMFE